MESKLKRKSMYLGVFVFIGVIVLLVGILLSVRNALYKSDAENIMTLTKQSAGVLSSNIMRDKKELETFGSMVDFSNAAETQKDMQNFIKNSAIEKLVITDEKGIGYDSEGARIDLNKMEQVHYPVEGKIHLSMPFYGENGQRQVAYMVPIIKDNALSGALYADYNLKSYYNHLTMEYYGDEGFSYVVNGETGEFVIMPVNAKGQGTYDNLYSLLEESEGNDAEEIKKFHSTLILDKSGTATLCFAGKPTYICFVPVEGTENWVMLTIIPKSVIQSAGTQVFVVMMTIYIAIITIAILLFYFYQKQEILKTRLIERQRNNEFLAAISRNIDTVVSIYDCDSEKFEYIFDNCEEVLGIDKALILDHSDRFLSYQEDPALRSIVEGIRSRTIHTHFSQEVVFQVEERRMDLRVSVYPLKMWNADKYIISFFDLREEKEIKETLQQALKTASYDALTNLLNRDAFQKSAEAFIQYGLDPKGYSVMFLIDTDDFKQANDRFGHQYGDLVLSTIARILKNSFRSDDLTARLGGDEFVALLKNAATPEVVEEKVQALCKSLAITKEDLTITCSVGAVIIKPGSSYKDAYEKADQAMYEAKRSGKNKYVILE